MYMYTCIVQPKSSGCSTTARLAHVRHSMKVSKHAKFQWLMCERRDDLSAMMTISDDSESSTTTMCTQRARLCVTRRLHREWRPLQGSKYRSIAISMKRIPDAVAYTLTIPGSRNLSYDIHVHHNRCKGKIIRRLSSHSTTGAVGRAMPISPWQFRSSPLT